MSPTSPSPSSPRPGSPDIIHFSDTHLGYSEYPAVDPATGVNARESDFNLAFRRVVDAIVARKPALAIHAGDLFDTVRPPNRAITEAIEGFRRIVAADIPLVVIAGNHETPRIRATGNIFRALRAALPDVHWAFDGEYRILTIGDFTVHAVPDAATDEALDANLAAVRAVPGRHNILVLHAGTSRLQSSVTSGEFNQHFVPHDRLKSFADFAYIAFGHYHRPMAIDGVKNAWYSGSTERNGFSDAGHDIGFLEVNLAPLRVRHVPVESRPMLDFGAIDCANRSDREILAALHRKLDGKVEGAVFRIALTGVAPQAMAAISVDELAEFRKPALHGEILQFAASTERGTGGESVALASLPVEFERYLRTWKAPDGLDPRRMRQLGLDYLTGVEQGEPS